MPKYLFTNLLGTFIFNEKFQLLDQIKFPTLQDYQNRQKATHQLQQKHPDCQIPSPNELKKILIFFKNKKNFPPFHQKNLLLTKQKIKQSINQNNFIIQTISHLQELDRILNILTKRLREWYSLYLPELVRQTYDNETFTNLILKKTKKDLLKELKLEKYPQNSKPETQNSYITMGTDLKKEDLQPILALAQQTSLLYQLRQRQETYLKNILQTFCPNLFALTNILAAKLLQQAGSLKKLALLPSSTIQLLGAEKALFRHLKTGAKSPKHGLLHEHPLIQKIPKTLRGKAARDIANKISLSARLDYFKGQFKADKFKKELEEKFLKQKTKS